MFKWKLLWPTIIFVSYTLVVFIELFIVYELKRIEWGQEGDFFERLGVLGSLLQYVLGFANIIAINPVIIGLGLVECGDGFFSLCLPSLLGVVINLLVAGVLIFIVNLTILKLIERRHQRRMVTKGN